MNREQLLQIKHALQAMRKAHEALMPGIKHISVPDYALINDAPIEALAAIVAIDRELVGENKQ